MMRFFVALRMTKRIFEKSSLNLYLLFLFAFANRTALLTQKNIWYDEAFSWHLSQLSFFNIYVVTAGDIHPPFYYFVLKIWNTIFGDSLLSIRMMSAVFSTASLYFVYKIAREYLSEKSSYLACILYIISPLNIFFAQEARMASLSLLLTAATSHYFVKVISTQVGTSSSNRIIRNNLIAYVIFSVLALYTHYFNGLIILSHFIYFLFIRKKREHLNSRLILVAFIILIALFIPWLPIMLKQILTGQPWREGQTLLAAGEQILDFMNDIALGFYYRFEKNMLTFVFQGITVLIAIAFSYLLCSRRSLACVLDVQAKDLRLPIFLAVIPIISGILVAFFLWIEFFRYLSIILPYIIISGFIVFQGLSEKVKVSIFLLFFVSNIYGDWLYFKKDFKNNDYRQVVADIRADSKPGDRIFVYPFYYRWLLEYYQKHGGLPEIFDYGFQYERLREELRINKRGEVFFILDHSFPDTSAYNEKLKDLQEDYLMLESKQYEAIPGRIELYVLKPKNY